MILVGLYLATVVLANLAIAHFGPAATIPVAFIGISLDLTTRDKLHDLWQGQRLWPRMLVLIGVGSIISALFSVSAAQIALGSFVAFLVSGLVDTAIYAKTEGRSKLLRMNLSNLGSSITDSILFPAIALSPFLGFGPELLTIMVGQAVAKFTGGLIWSFILTRQKRLTPLTETV